jgi:hypothetical protein
MRAEIVTADAQHTDLQKRVDDLQATARESGTELKKKLAAVNYRPHWQRWFEILGAFALGVLSSLVATAIASALHSRP